MQGTLTNFLLAIGWQVDKARAKTADADHEMLIVCWMSHRCLQLFGIAHRHHQLGTTTGRISSQQGIKMLPITDKPFR